MLPILLYNNMEGGSGSLNNGHNNFTQLYDENIILNSVRSRKKVSELPNCPVCSCTVRQGELESHMALEGLTEDDREDDIKKVAGITWRQKALDRNIWKSLEEAYVEGRAEDVERLQKLSAGGSKRKLSAHSPGGSAQAGPSSSTAADVPEDEVDVTGCPGGDVYQRVHSNRLRRLRARRRSTPPPQQGECPVCNTVIPMSRLQRHALRCLKRTGAEMDEDVPDSSSEDGSIDVENDEPSASFSEYEWCGEVRVRASALAPALPGDAVRPADTDTALVVDGDEDIELYGPAQYSPSRIAQDAEIPDIMQSDEQAENRTEDTNGEVEKKAEKEEVHHKPNGLVEASAETRIQALKAKIRDLEKKQNSATEAKCLICLGQYTSPAVSIQCWHVYCEVCWLQSLRAKKICPQCNAITTTEHLRRIYM